MANSSVELAMHDAEIAKIVQDNGNSMEEIFTDAIRKVRIWDKFLQYWMPELWQDLFLTIILE